MSKVLLVPTAGRMVPDPARGDLLPTAGREVIMDTYWQRRINEGDVAKQIVTKSKAKGDK